MDMYSRLGMLKDKEKVCIKTAGGHFVGTVVALSTTEVELRSFASSAKGYVVDEIAYIPIAEVRMIVHKLPRE